MKWVGKKWKQISASKRIVCLILVGTAVILGITAGLRIWDKSRQKPRVLTALKRLAEEAFSQEYSFAPLLQVIQEGNIEQEGYVNLTLPKERRWGTDSIWLEHMDLTGSRMEYRLAVQKKEKVFLANTQYQIAEIGLLNIESYLTEEKLIVRIPQMHSSYLRMNLKNLKNQYENSLLYGVLGEKLAIPESDFSVSAAPVFPQEKDLKKIEVIQAFLEEYQGRLGELWQQILVEKESETRQVLISGYYEDCNVFHLSLPMELVQWYWNYIFSDIEKEWFLSFDLEGETADFLIYMDDDNHIHQIKTLLEPKREGISYPIEVICLLKGEERLLDKIQIELHLKQQAEGLDFRIDLENQWEEGKRKIYFAVSQTSPKNLEWIRSNLVMDMDTGESHIEYEINLPLLVSDGEHMIRHLEQPIEAPNGEIVDLFELDFIGFLKFSKDFNFALFR